MRPLTDLLPSEYLKIAEEIQVPLASLVQTVSLLAEGASVPFLARYRRAVTGGLGEDRLRLLIERLEYFRQFEERRQAVLRAIQQQGKLTAELRARLEATLDATELADLHLSCKEPGEARAAAARQKGLGGLAEWLWAQQPNGETPEAMAAGLLDSGTGIESAEQALAGARDILAERISQSVTFRQALRKMLWEEGVILARRAVKAAAGDGAGRPSAEKKSKYEGYYDFHERVAKIPSHRLLAVRRGVKEGELEWEIRADDAKVVEQILGSVIRDRGAVFAPPLEAAGRDAYERLLKPAIRREVEGTLKERAEEDAIRVFQENLRGLLMAPPAGGIPVLGIAPGAVCKAAVVDGSGQLLESAPLEAGPVAGDGAAETAAKARALVLDLMTRHNVAAVAIGNGNGSREAEAFVRALLREEKPRHPALEKVFAMLVSEAGASFYSSSHSGKEEFPQLDPAARRAVSLARRLQDPMAEMAKIDPRAIGVGQYHHEADAEKLLRRLRATVESCVNQIGADLNTASAAVLQYVAGFNDRVARRIVEFRQGNGPFRSREQLKQLPGLSDRFWQQAAGFLRVEAGDNPLDRTAVHPESYPLAEKIAASLGVTCGELLERPVALDQLKIEELASEKATAAQLGEVCEALRRGGRDPRGAFVPPPDRAAPRCPSDLKTGTELEGTVTNVTNFGAFVDLGLEQDGLVHVSEMSVKFVQDPRAAVKVGDLVKVRVLAFEDGGRRISLTMKPAPPPRPARPPRARPAPATNGKDRRAAAPPPKAAAAPAARAEKPVEKPREKTRPARPPQPPPKPMSLDQKLAILQSKFRTRI